MTGGFDNMNNGSQYGWQNDQDEKRQQDANPYQSYQQQNYARAQRKNTWQIILLVVLVVVGILNLVSKFDMNLSKSDNEIKDGTLPLSTPARTYASGQEPSLGLQHGNASTDMTSSDDSNISLLERCRRSIVSISVETVVQSYYGNQVQTSSGSGVIITKDGYIATCNHVVEGADNITVALQDGTTYPAQIVGYDARTDLAVIKVEVKNELPCATLGISSNYKVGDRVYAIGNPLGEFASTVTDGIISGIDRVIEVDGVSMTLMQTNAAINPGNSGGGLFSAETGELLGIVNAKSYGIEIEGLGFAIPTDTAKQIISDLMDKGYVSGRPFIGISMQNVTTGGFSILGNMTTRVRIAGVSENSPAKKAGLQVGDYIVSFEGTNVTSSDEIGSLLNGYNAGDTIKMVVERANKQYEVEIVLGENSGN